MDIISVEAPNDPSLMKFKIGGAALVFEKAEDWKHHFKNLIVRNVQKADTSHIADDWHIAQCVSGRTRQQDMEQEPRRSDAERFWRPLAFGRYPLCVLGERILETTADLSF